MLRNFQTWRENNDKKIYRREKQELTSVIRNLELLNQQKHMISRPVSLLTQTWISIDHIIYTFERLKRVSDIDSIFKATSSVLKMP